MTSRFILRGWNIECQLKWIKIQEEDRAKAQAIHVL